MGRGVGEGRGGVERKVIKMEVFMPGISFIS